MKLIEALSKLKKLNARYIHTRDVAAYFNISVSHASKLLSRLCEVNQLISLKHSIWVFPEIDKFALPAVLSAPFPSYISLQSALYFHGMISQIPDVIYAVSLARTKFFKTSLGAISIHHLQPDFFCGYEETSDNLIKIASPEKALIDVFYFSDTKSKWFHALPELELPSKFTIKKAREFIKMIPSERKRTLVESSFSKLIHPINHK